jgi:hypothetical protein
VDAQKKQKVLLAVLAVCVLGAGSVFTIRAFSSSGPAVQQTNQVRQTGRRERAETEKVAPTRKRRTERKAAVKSKTGGRRERKEVTRRTTKRKRGKRSKAKRMKKTELKPMG